MKSHTLKLQKPASASKLAAAISAVLVVVKLYFYLTTGSLLVALSALDSAVDVGISYFNQRIIRFARQHADDDHPYGHGKAESIAAMAQGILIVCAAIAILFSGAKHLIELHLDNTPIIKPSGSLVVFFIVASGASLFISKMLSHYAKKFKSTALHGDSEHYRTDVFSNLANAIALFVVLKLQLVWLDATIAMALSVYLGFSGYKLIKQTIDELMDHDLSPELKQETISLILSCSPQILDLHRFRGRKSGHRLIFDFHISLPDTLAFREAHDIADLVEKTLSEKMKADVTVHIDPRNTHPAT